MVGDSTEDLEGTVQAEPDNHTHTDDEHPPPPLCRVSHALHVATWTAPASPAPPSWSPWQDCNYVEEYSKIHHTYPP